MLGVELDAFNHDNEEFSAIAATAMRHNAIGDGLTAEPRRFEPLFERTPDGEIDARPWCMGFYAAMKLRLLSWSKLLQAGSIDHRSFVADPVPLRRRRRPADARPLTHRGQTHAFARDAWSDIAPAVAAIREYWQQIRFNRK